MKRILTLAAISLIALFSLSASAQTYTKGWKVKANVGYYHANFEDNIDNVGVSALGLGYQLNKYIYVGVQAGLWGPVESDKNNALWEVPLTGTVEFCLPTNSKFTPVVDLNCGKTIINYGKGNVANPDYNIFEVLPGVVYKLGDRLDLQANVGYLKMVKTAGAYGHPEQNNYVFKLGVVFNL